MNNNLNELINVKKWKNIELKIREVRIFYSKYLGSLWSMRDDHEYCDLIVLFFFCSQMKLLNGSMFEPKTENMYIPTDEELLEVIEDNIDEISNYIVRRIEVKYDKYKFLYGPLSLNGLDLVDGLRLVNNVQEQMDWLLNFRRIEDSRKRNI